MAYLGVSPSNGVRQKHTYTATAGQTSFSGAGAENITLSYLDSNYVDVYQNGVKLSEADYTATTGTTVVLATGATVSDMIEIVVYDVFSVADTVSKADGGQFDGNVTMAGTLAVTGETTLATHLNMGDDDRIKLGADADMLIYHDGSHSSVQDNGTGDLRLKTNSAVVLLKGDSEILAQFDADGGCTFKHDNSTKLATSSSGVTVTGAVVADTLDVSGTVDFDGTTNLDVVDIDGAVDMAAGLTVTGATTITTADNTAQLVLKSTDADSASGPRFELNRDSGGPANADNIGLIVWKADDDAGNSTEVIQMLGVVEDVTNGSEYGSLDVRTMVAGNTTSRAFYDITETVFNDGGADLNFRIEGDSLTNLFVCDAGQESIAIGDANPTRHSKTTRVLCYQGSTTGTDFALHVGRVGTGAESQVCFSNGFGEVGSIKTNGTSTSFNTSSDYRLKENVVTEWDATTRLKQLKPSRFNFKTDANKTVDGFLAHEVSSIVPEAINGEKDATQDIGTIKDAKGNVELENVPESRKKDGQTWTKTGTENLYQDIDQSKLVPLLVKSLQEALVEIDTLKTKVTALENA